MANFDSELSDILARRLPAFQRLLSCERLSGGANQETYRLRVATTDGEQLFCLRRAAGGHQHLAPGQPGLAVEAQLFRAAAAAGVPEPEIIHVLEGDSALGHGFIMQWLEGEALGARIARSDRFDRVRPKLAFQCGELLARIHSIDLDASGLRDRLAVRDPEQVIRGSWALYQEYGTAQPMIDYTARWLLENLPERGELKLVHGDFRNGNLMVTPDDGVIAVLDWEGAHLGDPIRDLGWLCTNSWRFGVTEKVVGGFGELDDLLAGYASVTGKPVDPARVKFWIAYGSFNWAIGCLTMAEHYRTGPDATVERPAIGRRSSECQVDCANLLIPEPVTLPQVPQGAPDSDDMPRIDELLGSVRDFLRDDVMTATTGRTSFMARVASNSLDTVLRELAQGPVYRAEEQRRLQALLQREGDLTRLKRALCARLRTGSIALDDPRLIDYLRYATLTQALIDQPGYSGVRTALAQTGR
jgi:aminoglycoside phosphotransferase (APT) family kinase protein